VHRGSTGAKSSGPRPDASCEQLILSRSPEQPASGGRRGREGERIRQGEILGGLSLERDRNTEMRSCGLIAFLVKIPEVRARYKRREQK